MIKNIILATDSYKLSHWKQYPKDTEVVYSYFESRPGAEYDETVFFGLQYILEEYLRGVVVKGIDILEASELAKTHFGSETAFNIDGWHHIIEDHQGKLPLRIKAVPEGTPVPTGNVLMTVENTCDKCFWLTNAVESLLTHVWYSSTVATKSRAVKKLLAEALTMSADSSAGLDFMLQDFGYRGAASHESAAIGGAGHLVNFKGTDTLPAMLLAMEYYDADRESLGFSVPATEHSVMTARGVEGEFKVVEQLLEDYPTGILSVVADSYDIYRFVHTIGTAFRNEILSRDGTFVVRPDSTTGRHQTPEQLTTWIVNKLYKDFGGTINKKGFKVLNPKIRVLWGDGIDTEGIGKICWHLIDHGFSVENMVFGMGGGLLQKVNRDTQRFAFKCSAQKRSGEWHEVYKKPLDASKASKAGRLRLALRSSGDYVTQVREETSAYDLVRDDVLQTVFENGTMKNDLSFEQVRDNAKL